MFTVSYLMQRERRQGADFSLRSPTASQERGGKKRRRAAAVEMTVVVGRGVQGLNPSGVGRAKIGRNCCGGWGFDEV